MKVECVRFFGFCSAREGVSKSETSVRRFVINLIIRIGGIREGRNRAYREDEQGFVQPIERATGDIAGVVYNECAFFAFNLPDSCLSVSNEAEVCFPRSTSPCLSYGVK